MMGGEILFFLAVTIFYVNAVFEGESCVKNNLPGSCRKIDSCPAAIEDLKKRINPQICSYEGHLPIVCCVGQATRPPNPPPTPRPTTSRPPVATTPPRKPTTTEYVPTVADYQNVGDVSPSGCSPVPAESTSPKTGQKAFDKCIEYQEKYIFPCKRGVDFSGQLSRAKNCYHSTDKLVIGGVDASKYEFPHMALLGFGDNIQTVAWSCGGTIISEWYILTAGHCTYDRDAGDVTYALLGILKRSDQVDSSKLYRIGSILKHPDYKPPSKYNDIALLRTATQMQLDEFTMPACLPFPEDRNVDKAIATGWGATQNRGSTADTLQKVVISKFTSSECAAKFGPNRLMKRGFDANTQICYGDKAESKDTCQGDSGGPLQIRSDRLYCMYVVVGVTSFGKACGFIGEPGIYTHVQNFVPWIESVVWPN